VISVDDAFVVTSWNKGAEAMYGWTAEEALGHQVSDYVRGDIDSDKRAENRRETARARTRIAFVAQHKEGTAIDVDAISVAIHGDDGAVTGYVGIHRDVSERRRAERELRESHERTEAILDSITDEFIALDREWRYTYVNPGGLGAIRTALGRDVEREGVLGKRVSDLFPGFRETAVYGALDTALRENRAVHSESYSEPDDRWIAVRAYPSAGGLLTYTRDVTERRRAAGEREVRARQRAVMGEIRRRAVATADLRSFMDEACEVVARALEVESVGVAEILPAEKVLLCAGVGWSAGVVGSATGSAGRESLVGFTVMAAEPVVSEDVTRDDRFEVSPALFAHAPASAASVVISGRGKPFGALGAFSRERRSFSADDISFLLTVADVISAALERADAERARRDAREAEGRLRAAICDLRGEIELDAEASAAAFEQEHADRSAVATLTPREREVLQALADGPDSHAIADRLHITLRTERNHVANILAKLGVHSQLQALVFALRYDLVEIRPAPERD
jgi:PAS domain S-box-containing protein